MTQLLSSGSSIIKSIKHPQHIQKICYCAFHTVQLFHEHKRRADIYCHGVLLKTIQGARIFKDSKHFVDMKMRLPPSHIVHKFNKFMRDTHNEPTKSQIRQFVATHFQRIEREFEPWWPGDWTVNPKFIDNIQDDEFRDWALVLNDIWRNLGKKIKQEVKLDEEMYSIIYVENGMIVPGGRFRDFYYWDSYWIMLGLLLCEMTQTVKGMLENFISIIDTYGFIPNGGRIYYLQRSQPPLFTPMMKLYLDATKDIKFLKDNIHACEVEFNYWMAHHTVDVDILGRNHTLAIYGEDSLGPRPESYIEDVEIADKFQTNEEKEEFYSEIKAAAESGWDFSGRWFILNVANKGDLTNIKTRSIVPVDLNAILYWNASLLSDFYNIVGDKDKANEYKKFAIEWKNAVTAVLWHDDVGIWLDYDLDNLSRRNYFYPSNVTPLWTGCYRPGKRYDVVRKVVKYLRRVDCVSPGGVPTSFDKTGQQWDYPNAWSPLQHIMVEGLRKSGNKEAATLAFSIVKRWVRNNFSAYKKHGDMFEKYDVVGGGLGGGGEYKVQTGFGWTNGVILSFLDTYGSKLTHADFPKPIITQGTSSLSFGHVSRVLFE